MKQGVDDWTFFLNYIEAIFGIMTDQSEFIRRKIGEYCSCFLRSSQSLLGCLQACHLYKNDKMYDVID